MFKHSRKTDVPRDGAKSSETEGKGSWFKENQRSIIAVGLIVIMAFIMRFVFAYGVSAGSAFALSGGTVASEHLHTITQILSGGSFFGADDTLSYPFGSVNSNPVLIDSILAGIAMIGTSLGMSAVKAASLTLATFSLVCGTAAVIPMFLLGKEVVGTRKAGFVAALFLAFCPIVISQTVFSNGTETGWILLLFIILSLLMFKGLKAITVSSRTDDPFKETIAANKSALRLAALSGIVLALIVLSTNDFRPIVVLLIIAMAIMTVAGRFMYRDTRPVVLFFSIIILIGMAVATAYYIPAQLWDQVLSGILILSAASVVLCLTFSILQRKPWVVTVPVYIIGVIVAFVLLSFFAPEFFSVILEGNTIYAACIAPLADGSLSVSFVSTAFGVVTMWFTIFVIGVLIWKIPKNISSLKYQFLVIFMFFSASMAFESNEMATVFSPVFALGFAYIVMWLFDHVDFKTYFMTIKNAGWKGAWKKVLKPIPFATILIIAGLLCVPIGMYAIDASISNNEKSDFEGLSLGAIGYYVKTDDNWTVGPVFKSYADVNKDGALVTWADYANDAATMGKFKVIVDGEGNGGEAVSNILLSNAVDGSSDAAMLIYLLTYTGMTDDVKTKLAMTEDDYNTFKGIMENPSQYRNTVVTDTSKYGILESDVSDDNIRYIYGSEFLTEKYSAYVIADMCSAIAGIAGNISYFMVDGSMFPLYYGYSSMFSTMAYANGYVISDNYGTVPQFLTVGSYTPYTGIYEYTDAMYNTLMWRAYIGMSPEEAGVSAVYQYFQYLMLSDGTYKAHPGYGLSNYTVDYDHWYVMYNSDNKATLSSDGWEKMLYTEAVYKQNNDGGLINYLSGLPVFMKYVPNSTGNAVSGHVSSSAAANVQGIRVSVVDSEGTIRSTAYTDEEGNYKVLVPSGENIKIEYYAGSQNLADGNLIQTVDASTVVEGEQSITIPATTARGTFVDSNGDDEEKIGAIMTIKGKVSKETYNCTATATGFEFVNLVPDVYDVTLKSSDGNVVYASDKTITVIPGVNVGMTVKLDMQKVKITVKDDTGAPVKIATPQHVDLYDASTGRMIDSFVTDQFGEKEMNLVSGSYYCKFSNDYVSSSVFTISSTSSSVSVTASKTNDANFDFGTSNAYRMITIYSTGYQTTALTNASGVASVKLPAGTGAGAVYTAYLINGTQGYIITSDAPATLVPATLKVTGTMKNSSDETTSGTIVFSSGLKQIPVSVASDGTYSVYLTGDEYTVYANSGSEVSISKITPTAEMVNDIKLGEGTQVYGSTTWGSGKYSMPFVPIDVFNISGCDGCAFTVTTNDSGAYSFYIPKDSTCDLTVRLMDAGKYNYGGQYTKTVSGKNGSVEAFNADVTGNVSVTNNSGFKVKIGDKIIDNGSTADVPISSGSWTVVINDDGKYGSRTVRVNPDNAKEFEAEFFEKIYYEYEVTGLEEGMTVSVNPTNGGSFVQPDKTVHKYYLEWNDTEDRKYMFTIKNADSSKIMYKNETIDHILPAAGSFVVDAAQSATIEGYVGYSGSGTMTVTYDAESYDFSITSGRYSIPVPVGKAITLSASLKNESTSVTYTYTDSVAIGASDLVAGSTYVYNMAVKSATGPGTDKVDSTMTVESTVDGGLATVNFVVEFTKDLDGYDTTYSLTGGSKWSDVKFYSDLGRTVEITHVNFDDHYTIYGTGKIIKSNVAYADNDLSVILKDPSGNTVCTATIKDGDAAWGTIKKTPTEASTKVSIVNNSLGDSEYMYAIQIVNDDNFTKRFTLADLPAEITDKWFVTCYNGKEITTNYFDVKGYSTATVYVKITYKTGDTAPELPGKIIASLTVKDLSGNNISVMSTDTKYDESTGVGVSFEGNVATVYSKTSDSTVVIDGSGASGRDVVDNKSDMPIYDWVLIALAVALVFIIIWAASKRGVFSRKK